MIFVDNKNGLIGDVLGTFPTIQTLSKKDTVIVKVHPESKHLYDLIKSPKILIVDSFGDLFDNKLITLDCSIAFSIAANKNYYMTQAFMEEAELEVPNNPPKAKLSWKSIYISKEQFEIDYLLSPFARSLTEDQKWPIDKWLELVRALPDKKFGVLGNSKYDEKNIWQSEKNVVPLYDFDFGTICTIYKYVKCLISVVTGTSHLAFHLGVKNVLLTNQTMTWGNNPDAIKLTDYIPNITVQQVIEKL